MHRFSVRHVAALFCLLCSPSGFAWNDAEDEARIEALIQTERAARATAAPTPARAAAPAALLRKSGQLATTPVATPAVPQALPPREITFADMSNLLGKSVTVRTKRGREHNGTVESWTPKKVTLSVLKFGGKYSFELRRTQIVRATTAGG